MKRSSTSEESSDSKRFEAFSPQLYHQQQEQYQALQREVQQYAANQQQQQQQQSQQQQPQQQQQQQLQTQQLDATHQQQLQQYAAAQQYAANQQVQSPQGTQSYSANQQISTAQQQQFTNNQQYYNPAAYYTMNSMNSMGAMNSINYSQFVPPPPPSPMMYNTSPSWNFMSQPPPSFYATTPPPSTPCQPPLPPPDLKPEKPPLPKEPEPGTEGSSSSVDSGGGTASVSVYNGMSGLGLPRPQNPLSAIGLRGLNGINTGFNSFNGGLHGLGGRSTHLQSNNNAMMHKMNVNLSGMRGRRRNPHFFPQMLPAKFLSPPMDLQRFGDFDEFARLIETENSNGSEKLTIYLGKKDLGKVQVNKKAKRKPMSTRYTRTKQWIREEAEAAIALEKEFNRMQRRPMLILKFPDPDLNKYIVKKYSPLIDTVHFQQPSTPRYCFVQLKEGADVDKVINTIRQIPFGTGKITAELKNHHVDDQPVTPEGIDPYTLYIGNLPTHISVRVVKQYFPNAQRIDIGYAQRMRYTRYAFIRYNTVAEAMASYKRTVNALLDSRSLIVRFRRQKGNIGLPGEVKKTAALQDGNETLKSQDPKGLDPDESVKTAAAQNSEPVEEDADDEEDDETAERSTVTSNGKNASVKPNASKKSVSPAISSADSETRSSTCTPLESKPKISKDLAKQSKQSIPSDDLSDSQSKEGRADDSPAAQESFESDADSKDRVLQEANDLMIKKMDLSYRRSSISSSTYGSFAKPPGHVEGDIKLEETDDDSSDDGGINLLGTRVKDEPCEEPNRPPTPSLEDIYLDDYEYDDLDCEPEEEDDEWATNSETTDWDEVRRNELAVRESKPDLEQLSSTNDFPPTEEVSPIPADLEPKPEFENFFDPPTKKKNIQNIFNKKDDLHDMFAQLNSDPECDEEDAFFN